MKKTLLISTAVLLILVLTAAAILLVGWRAAGPSAVPQVRLAAAGQPVAATGYEWQVPVLGGLAARSHVQNTGAAPQELGEYNEDTLPLALQGAAEAQVSATLDGTLVFSGSVAQWNAFSLEQNGLYAVTVHCHNPPSQPQGQGSFAFAFTFTRNVTPPLVVRTSADTVAQGDVWAVRVDNLPAGSPLPTITTTLGALVLFAPVGEDSALAVVGVTHNRTPGAYSATVSLGEETWQFSLTVTATDFPSQHLIIDESDPVITEANSAAAYAEYHAKIPPLFDTFDEAIYWSGAFIQPSEGALSTPYASMRYTNDNPTPRYHTGIDIASPLGSPVLAPAAGRVVLSEYLLNTGNTIVIEHGGGLKSYFFHMDTRTVETGAMVEQGQPLGTVGSTGYSTGPHLHYEVRLGHETVDPLLLFAGTAGLFL